MTASASQPASQPRTAPLSAMYFECVGKTRRERMTRAARGVAGARWRACGHLPRARWGGGGGGMQWHVGVEGADSDTGGAEDVLSCSCHAGGADAAAAGDRRGGRRDRWITASEVAITRHTHTHTHTSTRNSSLASRVIQRRQGGLD
jgi:hypothetical protein